MEQTDTPVRSAVETVLGEYHAWLLANLGEADIAKAGEERKHGTTTKPRGGGRGRHEAPFAFDVLAPGEMPGDTPDEPDDTPDETPVDTADETLTLDAVLAAVTLAVEPLAARLDAMERDTPGRKSGLGDDVQKAAPRRGLHIFG